VKRSKGFGKAAARESDPVALRRTLQRAVQHLQLGQLQQAKLLLERVLASQPDQPEALHFLGIVLIRTQRYVEATIQLRRAVTLRPEWAEAHSNLGIALQQQERIDEAVFHCQKALALKSELLTTWHYLATLLVRQGKLHEALAALQSLLARKSDFPGVHNEIGNVLHGLGRLEEALEAWRREILLQPQNPTALVNLGNVTFELGQTAEAIGYYQRCAVLQPLNGFARWRSLLALPILYKEQSEIETWRTRFTKGLKELIRTTDLTVAQQRQTAIGGAKTWCNFHLPYQGEDDTHLQTLYGDFLHRLMATEYPQWSTARIPDISSDKIHIGYLSAHLCEHSGAQWALGWLQNHDRSQFVIHCYHIGTKLDADTERFRELSDHFHHIPGSRELSDHVLQDIPGSLEAICHQILSDKLHILVYTDIGMFPLATQLAALRLAPIQCTAWGHPVTSGLPTVDYYLSSEAMEPPDGDAHYTETLVRLPRLGLCLPRTQLVASAPTRQDLGLPSARVLYLSSQSTFKYLPQYDCIFPRIAIQVEKAHFVFIANPSSGITEQFRQRLETAFAAAGMNAEEYVSFLPRLTRDGFREMHHCIDVCLDTIDWSGGNTTLVALAYHRPVVTIPGRFMRGRHTSAMLQVLGVTETIASDLETYVEIAVRLGCDANWRAELSERIAAGQDRLFDDRDCVAALDAFFREAVAKVALAY
jgi:protein O-GlcNAc transferase